MQQVDVERSQEFRKCIECFLCQDVCHVVRDHEDNKQAFAGPRFLMRVAELDMHPLDTADRRPAAREEHGLGYCNITKCCTEVCPEHIKITDNALIPLKERVVDRHYDPVVWLGEHDPTAQGLTGPRLGRDFFAEDVLDVAPALLGCTVTHAGVTVRLTEVEAYAGLADPGLARVPWPDAAHRGDVRSRGSPLRLLHLRDALVRQRRLRSRRRGQRGAAAGG